MTPYYYYFIYRSTNINDIKTVNDSMQAQSDPEKRGEKGYENLKNSNPGPLVHDRVVEAEDGNVIVIPLSLSALSRDFEIWMKCQILPPLSPDPSGCTSYAPPILQS